MANDTISRQAAIDTVIKLVQEAEYRYPKHMAIPEFVYQGVVSIRELPSAERRGRWEFNIDDKGWSWDKPYMCDQCGEWAEKEFKFCPNCGARMEV